MLRTLLGDSKSNPLLLSPEGEKSKRFENMLHPKKPKWTVQAYIGETRRAPSVRRLNGTSLAVAVYIEVRQPMYLHQELSAHRLEGSPLDCLNAAGVAFHMSPEIAFNPHSDRYYPSHGMLQCATVYPGRSKLTPSLVELVYLCGVDPTHLKGYLQTSCLEVIDFDALSNDDPHADYTIYPVLGIRIFEEILWP